MNAHFARPGNRFWPALALAGITPTLIDPSAGMTSADRAVLVGAGIGISNLVPYATARADELTTAQIRDAAASLTSLVERTRPRVVAVLGLTAYRQAFDDRLARQGRQPNTLAGAELWVLPNPSGLNAHETALSLAAAYRRAAALPPGSRCPNRRSVDSRVGAVATAQQWFSAARPRTLPAAVAPVLVGTGAGFALGGFSWLRGGLALIVSLALQVGVNYSNDYSDGIRGTDADRVGPTRLVGSGLARPSSVKKAAFACFGVAGAGGSDPGRAHVLVAGAGRRRGGRGRLVLHRRPETVRLRRVR